MNRSSIQLHKIKYTARYVNFVLKVQEWNINVQINNVINGIIQYVHIWMGLILILKGNLDVWMLKYYVGIYLLYIWNNAVNINKKGIIWIKYS
jgi:hypothetical protein